MSDPVKGSCLCGEVTYEITGHMKIFQYCHCSRCRKVSGSAFAAGLLVPPDQFHWTQGEKLVGRYEVPETSHFATSFCTKCGSSLPWLAKSGKIVVIPAGTLDDTPDIHPNQNIFCGSKAGWYEEPSALPQHDTLPGKK